LKEKFLLQNEIENVRNASTGKKDLNNALKGDIDKLNRQLQTGEQERLKLQEELDTSNDSYRYVLSEMAELNKIRKFTKIKIISGKQCWLC
jgi:hypothetical protein